MPKITLSQEKAEQIRKMYFSRQATQEELAKLFNEKPSIVSRICLSQARSDSNGNG